MPAATLDKRKMRTTREQREEIRELCRALDRTPRFPVLTLDADIEIAHLTRLLESHRRLGWVAS